MVKNRLGEEIAIKKRVKFHGREGVVVDILNRSEGDVVAKGIENGEERIFTVDHNDCELA